MHDGCFFQMYPASAELKGALLDAVLAEHARYLERDVNWARVRPALLEEWSRGVTLRMRAWPARRQLIVRRLATNSSLLERLFAKSIEIDCSTGFAEIIDQTSMLSQHVRSSALAFAVAPRPLLFLVGLISASLGWRNGRRGLCRRLMRRNR